MTNLFIFCEIRPGAGWLVRIAGEKGGGGGREIPAKLLFYLFFFFIFLFFEM